MDFFTRPSFLTKVPGNKSDKLAKGQQARTGKGGEKRKRGTTPKTRKGRKPATSCRHDNQTNFTEENKMALAINTNIASINAQRNLNKSQAPLQTAMQRLSSTLRINSAKDDAAGLAIATRMLSQARGLSQAVRNANDGISVAQTAEGALEEVGTSLQRIRELAVQSAHGMYTSAERNAMNAEAQQLVAEINRIADQTRFSTVNLLDGTFGTKGLQVGAQANETINISLGSVRSASILGAYTTSGTTVTSAPFVSGDVTFTTGGNLFTVGASLAGDTTLGQTTDSAWSKAQAINLLSAASGIGATALDTGVVGTALTNVVAADIGVSFTINSKVVSYALSAGQTANAQLAALKDAVNAAGAGVAATIAGNQIVLTGAGGVNIDIAGLSTAETAVTGLADATGASAHRSRISLVSNSSYTIGGTAPAKAGFSAGAATLGVGAVDISTDTGANLAIAAVDRAIGTVSTSRSDIGAVLNRLESTVRNLENVVENVTAARSRIMDADFAAETANLTKAMIMQQAGISVLSQANNLPQNVMALLGGR